jgi:hypothetical protein
LSALAISIAAGVGLVAAPIVSTLTATPASATGAITAVGSQFTVSGAGLTTLADNPVTVGDVLVVGAEPGAATPLLTAVSGGGVTTWTRAVHFAGANQVNDVEIWYGTVTTTGVGAVTFTWGAPGLGAQVAVYSLQEFSAGTGAGSVWTVDTSGGFDEPSTSLTVTYPSLTAAASGELYFGFADMPSAPAAGTTPGFTYNTTANGNQVAFNPAVTAGVVAPTSSQGALHFADSAAVLLVPPPNPTVTSVSPTGGPIAGGTSVTVSGTNLTGETAVNFGATPGTSVVVNGGGTSLTVTSPAEPAGTVNVTVVTPAGTSATSAADNFTFFAVPTVTAVTPTTGSSNGGSSVTVTGTNLTGATAVKFGTASGTNVVVNGAGTSLAVTSPAGTAGVVDVTVTTPGGTSATSAADQFTYQNSGYWMVGNDGGIFSFGGAPFEGSLPGLGVHVTNVVGMVPTATGKGYWMVGTDGGVFAFGDAGFVGSLPGINVHVSNIVGVVPTADGKGYWMVGTDGGVFAFGDAGFVGSLPGINVHVSNIVAVVPTASGKGYWMIGSDGGVFAFGDAGFVGSLPGIHVTVNNIVGAVPTSTGKGYWMIGSDGGVFAFGDAGFVGSLPGINVHVTNVVGVVATPTGKGYWMVGSDGGVFAFGDANFVGSIPGLGIHINNIVAFARQ